MAAGSEGSQGIELSWIHLSAEGFRREQWCADGDGLYVVKACSTGFWALDQNSRKKVGKFADSESAIKGLEAYMREHDPATFEYLMDNWPA